MNTDPTLRLLAFPAAPPPRSTEELLLQNRRLQEAEREAVARTLFERPEEEPPRPGELALFRAQRSAEQERFFLERFWRSAALEEQVTLEQTLPFRVRAGWRIAREMARLKNACSENELLIEALPPVPDPWSESCSFVKPSSRRDVISQKRYMLPLWNVVELICQDEGLPLLPPPVPAEWREEDGEVRPDYEPERDTRLMAWIRAAELIVAHYSMGYRQDEFGAAAPCELSQLGLAGLLDPMTCRRAFPTRTQVVFFEEMLIEETIRKCLLGKLDAADYLQKSYSLREREVRSMLAIAASEIRSRQGMDIEEKRALMEHRLEEFVRRAQVSFDLSQEIKGLKVLAVVQGLTRTESEDANRDFLEATQKVADSRPSMSPELRVIDVPVLPPKTGG